jgi:hypothetical protein
MVKRVLTLSLAAVTLALFSLAVRADDKGSKTNDPPNRHEGRVVSVTNSKLVMVDLDGKEQHAMDVVNDAKISVDGKICKLNDLKPGQKIRVTSKNADRKEAVKIEALDRDIEFPKVPTTPPAPPSK